MSNKATDHVGGYVFQTVRLVVLGIVETESWQLKGWNTRGDKTSEREGHIAILVEDVGCY